MSRVVLASSNHGKLVEMREVLAGIDIAWIAQTELGITDADETATTFVENALLKARHAARISGLPALGGGPGLYSARYSGRHGDAAANIAKLLATMRDVPEAARTAHFYCVIALLRNADDPAPLIAQGRWDGRILDAPRGTLGFGYDPVFFDPALGVGAAELDATVKNRISHRGQALARLRELLVENMNHLP